MGRSKKSASGGGDTTVSTVGVLAFTEIRLRSFVRCVLCFALIAFLLPIGRSLGISSSILMTWLLFGILAIVDVANTLQGLRLAEEAQGGNGGGDE